MACPPATSEAGPRPLEGQLSLQINECLGAISLKKPLHSATFLKYLLYQMAKRCDIGLLCVLCAPLSPQVFTIQSDSIYNGFIQECRILGHFLNIFF
jgi:hypothetical protein